MTAFAKINRLTGWLLFLLTLVVYTMTLEPTASFWDPGEFIAVSYKLMVPHPPGAPLFLMINRIFSMFALGDVQQVAWWVNFESAFSSALTIMFLYWTIVLVARKLVTAQEDGSYSAADTLKLVGSGVVGALAYAFSDSFWFSAVEAEVYAMSSAFTAVVFWAIFRWERIEDAAASNRWLILIAYVIGLSIGVHLLNLVAIPALAMVYYYHRYKHHDLKGLVIANLIGLVIMAVIVVGIIPGLPSMAFAFDLLAVNTFGLPFSYGGIFFVMVLFAALVYGIYYTQQRAMALANTALLSMAFILVGYASYTLVLIRSNEAPPINENAPDNLLSYVSYLKREQYGERPLLSGPHYMARPESSEKGKAKYRRDTTGGADQYVVYDYDYKRNYKGEDTMLFPRIYSSQGNHIGYYQQWLDLRPGEKPTFGDNLRFFFDYQLGHMYFRYFMWNFAGRESDEKDAGWTLPWDMLEKDLPEMLSTNKARTNFLMIPLILGIAGLLFQQSRDGKSFLVVLALFVLTGVALVVYLNSPPVEPRERDYIYVGSFYAFAVWIGLGVFALCEWLGRFLNARTGAMLGIALSMSAPALMAAQGWESHDRSGRYLAVDQARNTLAGLPKNAILFTGGDNDTFPLWYVQNVEGFRTDVRVAVLSYFSTDWYLKQMKQQQYESTPLPIKLKDATYIEGKNDYIPLVGEPDGRAVNLKAYLQALDEERPELMVALQGGGQTASLLSDTFVLDVDSSALLKKGIVPKGKEKAITGKMVLRLRQGADYILKNELALLDLIANGEWDRPIYFNNTSANIINLNVRPYLQLEGMVYRLLPVLAEDTGDVGEVNTEVFLENLKGYQYRGLQDSAVYHDDESRKFATNMQYNIYRLAEALYAKGQDAQAKQVMDEMMRNIPDKSIPHSFYAPRFVDLYHRLGDHQQADALAELIARRSEELLAYELKTGKAPSMLKQQSVVTLQQLAGLYQNLVQEQGMIIASPMATAAQKAEAEQLRKRYEADAAKYRKRFEQVYGR